jgi:hypothetical protein
VCLQISLKRFYVAGEGAFKEVKPAATWQLNFAQPASDYLKFRSTIEQQNVGLENVVLKNDVCILTATVKLKNLAFDKQVCVCVHFPVQFEFYVTGIH